MQINDDHKFNITKTTIMEREYQLLWEIMNLIKENKQIIYLFESAALRAMNFLNTRYSKRNIPNKSFQTTLEGIEKYFCVKFVEITEDNILFLLNISYLYKLASLRNDCEIWKENIKNKECNFGISNCIIRKYSIIMNIYTFIYIHIEKPNGRDSVLNHNHHISSTYCSKCQREVCIDCHL